MKISSPLELALVGFDSAWTNDPKNPGAICALMGTRAKGFTLIPPALALFDDALTFIKARQAEASMCLIAIDQPTIVPNLTSCRPVERVAGSVVGFVGGGVQSTNRSKLRMFNDDAPIWLFKSQLQATEDPSRSRLALSGLHIIEVFPALALPALHDRFFGRHNGPRYNPDRKKRFRLDDWQAVARLAGGYGLENAIEGLPSWARAMASITEPCKADQDQLDAVLCAIIAHHWMIKPARASAIIGDLLCGYMVTPVSTDTRERLAAKAQKLGVNITSS